MQKPKNLQSVSAWITRAIPTPRRTPITFSYLTLLCVGYYIVYKVVPVDMGRRFLISISTTVPAMQSRPLIALIGSMLVLTPPLWSISSFMTLVVGIAWCMGAIERRHGTSICVAAFVAGHVGATLITTGVKIVGISAHFYNAPVLREYDFGPSYGTVAIMALTIPLLPSLARPVWLLGGISYLLYLATWYGPIPDFTTVGHLSAVVIGLACVAALHRRNNRPITRDMNKFGAPASGPPSTHKAEVPGRESAHT
ncbi:rhomboid-like protein [Actinomadura montaniterrae]|uniref:rhomboid-like protein n=1 Tax=Actinomadura montaniterrae TaxID=1803903 RepID=UPI001CEF627B|nr:rhomboid-like protein [Actinomadura montaniterrae]